MLGVTHQLLVCLFEWNIIKYKNNNVKYTYNQIFFDNCSKI